MDTVYVLRVTGISGRFASEQHDNPVGQFVCDFKPLECDGLGRVYTSPHLHHALAFRTKDEAIGYYRQVPAHRPTRPDGRPNRPLTAMMMEVLAAGVEEA